MPTGDSSALQLIVYILLSILCAYGGGRVHEWYKHSMDRDRSFREGYNHGYHALFPVAARNKQAPVKQFPADRPDAAQSLSRAKD